jgi:hypothetical protein
MINKNCTCGNLTKVQKLDKYVNTQTNGNEYNKKIAADSGSRFTNFLVYELSSQFSLLKILVYKLSTQLNII